MPIESRKVFISWSKTPTDHIATELARFLKHMFDNVKPFVSKDNVAFGSLSIGEIHRQLSGTSFGILIVTRANQQEPWLNFEAGSLAKTIPDDASARVVPLLIDHESMAQLTGPIANLQAVMADEAGIRRLMQELGDTLGIDASVFESRWSTGWAHFEQALVEGRKTIEAGPAEPDRTPDDMLQEVLAILRARSASPHETTVVVDAEEPTSDDELLEYVSRRLDSREINFESIAVTYRSGQRLITVTLPRGAEIVSERDEALLRMLVRRKAPGTKLNIISAN